MCSSEWKEQYDGTEKPKKLLLFYKGKLGQDHVAIKGLWQDLVCSLAPRAAKHHGKVWISAVEPTRT